MSRRDIPTVSPFVMRGSIRDGTGSVAIATLAVGEHWIHFEVSSTHDDFEKKDEFSVPLWEGEGSTKSIGFKLNKSS